MASPRVQPPYRLVFGGPGRPSQLSRMVELAKMAWSPVLDMLGKEVRFNELARRPYSFEDSIRSPLEPSVGTDLDEARPMPGVDLRWLRVRDVIQIHDEMISTFGGETGVLNRGRIDAALDAAFSSPISGHEPFPSVVDKAASLMHSVLLYHPFVDGQKRTGISTAFILLGVNGYFMWSRDPADEVHFAIHVAQGEFEVPDIARWIRARIIPPSLLRDPIVVSRLLPFAEKMTRSCTSCHHSIRVGGYQVTCPNCRANYVVVLNAGLYQGAVAGRRFYVQAGLKRVSRGLAPGQRTLDRYLARLPEASRRRGLPHNSS